MWTLALEGLGAVGEAVEDPARLSSPLHPICPSPSQTWLGWWPPEPGTSCWAAWPGPGRYSLQGSAGRAHGANLACSLGSEGLFLSGRPGASPNRRQVTRPLAALNSSPTHGQRLRQSVAWELLPPGEGGSAAGGPRAAGRTLEGREAPLLPSGQRESGSRTGRQTQPGDRTSWRGLVPRRALCMPVQETRLPFYSQGS